MRKRIENDLVAILELEPKTLQSMKILFSHRDEVGDLEVDRRRVKVDGGVTQSQAATVEFGLAPIGSLDSDAKPAAIVLRVGLGRVVGVKRLGSARRYEGKNEEQEKIDPTMSGHGSASWWDASTSNSNSG
jgi:hypothetical protein